MKSSSQKEYPPGALFLKEKLRSAARRFTSGERKENKDLLFLFNPHAGKEQIRNRLLDIIDLFTKNGYTVTAHPTQCRGDAVEIVQKRASDYDLVVCSGGDGTLDEVVTGMMRLRKRVPIGYIPTGSTNDFAGSLKIPKKMMRAAQVIVRGREFPCDIGRFNEDTFVYIAAFGLFTDVSYKTNQSVKNVLGYLAYILEGVKRLSSIKSYRMRVMADGRRFRGKYLYGMVTNSRFVGGFKNITGRNVALDDGLFEVTLIKFPRNPIELNKIVTALVSANFDTDMMHSFKASEVLFYAQEKIPWTLDGEFGGNHRRVHIQNQKHAMRFLVP